MLFTAPATVMRMSAEPAWTSLPPWLLKAPASTVICLAEVLPPSWTKLPATSTTSAPLPTISPVAPL